MTEIEQTPANPEQFIVVGAEWSRPSCPVPTVVTIEEIAGDSLRVKWGRRRYTVPRSHLLSLFRPWRVPDA